MIGLLLKEEKATTVFVINFSVNEIADDNVPERLKAFISTADTLKGESARVTTDEPVIISLYHSDGMEIEYK